MCPRLVNISPKSYSGSIFLQIPPNFVVINHGDSTNSGDDAFSFPWLEDPEMM
jgi:hypothetical protein